MHFWVDVGCSAKIGSEGWELPHWVIASTASSSPHPLPPPVAAHLQLLLLVLFHEGGGDRGERLMSGGVCSGGEKIQGNLGKVKF